jgi:hypothetical protein
MKVPTGTVTQIQDAPISVRRDPLIGWRLWRVRGTSLRSWGIDSRWSSGDNTARCLAAHRDCSRSPGRACMCGFWGLFDPLTALRMARDERQETVSVLGLVRGWGECAIHAGEGFRSQHARVVCLFSDWPWDAAVMPPPRSWSRALWWRLQRSVGYVPPRPRRDPGRERSIRGAAVAYGVPLVRLADAARHGVLEEYGADGGMVRAVERWLQFSDGARSAGRGGERPLHA